MKKKSQMEIMGLAIIIILISLGMIFVVKFVVLNKPTEFKKSFTQTELASNIINSFLRSTSSDCYGLSMTELLQDCAQSKTITCEDGLTSCAYVKEVATIIFSKTLVLWNLDYEFKTYVDEDSPIFKLGETCENDKVSKLFPVPTAVRTLYVKLDICG